MAKMRLFFLFALLLAILIFFQACVSLSDEKEDQISIMGQVYLFDPQSLFEDVQRETNPFFPVKIRPDYLLPSQQILSDWGQDDYLFLVSAIFQFAWMDSADAWSLNQMIFETNCSRIEHGFQRSEFRFFKNIKTRERESRLYRYIDIDARSNSIYIREAEFYPRLANWFSIELADIKISADLALQKADDDGGKEKRLSLGNTCYITVELIPDSPKYKGWYIRYTLDGRLLYQIPINPLTGKTNFP